MTSARSVGGAPAGRLTLNLSFRRGAAFAAAGVLAALNAQADQVVAAVRAASLSATVGAFAAISAVIWLAMYAAMKIGFEDSPSKLNRKDLLALGTIAFLACVPVLYAAKAGLLLCGLYLFITSARGDAGRRVSLLLLALTGPLIWGRLLLHIFSGPILAIDAAVVGSLIGTPAQGNIIHAVEGQRFFIAEGCSSLHNMSLAIVLWTTAAVLFHVRIDRRFMLVGLGMIIWMFVVNVGRIALIGLSPEHYYFFHEGTGAALFGWASLLGAGALAFYGVLHADIRRR